ncbi:hypothetical protein Tco_0555159, partial [Tanacetum coccineum]
DQQTVLDFDKLSHLLAPSKKQFTMVTQAVLQEKMHSQM